ncbi:hypothetical protein [Teredinibacter purpureus]|uniref:hypothetical protein n=1 Tax=Teredinibacter purpureus TaxID=2731756 RepID=UPI0005F7F1BD|nr:hypothetical protein [Teredinibacter purpureus]
MKSLKFWLIVSSACCILLVAFCALPHTKYLRYKALDIGAYSKASWIYERIVFDPTPLDIVFVGTSHTLNAVDSEVFETELNARIGAPKHVANLAIPHFGRDMHRLIGEQIFEHRRPELMIIEVRESEERDQHPATHYLADSTDLVAAPLIVNMRYMGNLIRLPFRQTRLFFQSIFPELFGVSAEFSPEDYAGPHVNYALAFPDGGAVRDYRRTASALTKERNEWDSANGFKLQRGNKWRDHLNFNANRSNLTQLVAQAKSHGTKVVFLYLPNYASNSRPIDVAFYESMGPVLYLKNDALYSRSRLWADLGHLNAIGAQAFSVEVAEVVAREVLAR